MLIKFPLDVGGVSSSVHIQPMAANEHALQQSQNKNNQTGLCSQWPLHTDSKNEQGNQTTFTQF